jgi:hypothetical protein
MHATSEPDYLCGQCILLTQPVLEACDAIGASREPFLLALATSANIGSALTLIGNPQNVLIAGYSGYCANNSYYNKEALLGLSVYKIEQDRILGLHHLRASCRYRRHTIKYVDISCCISP